MESICLKGSRWLTSDACSEFRMAYCVYRASLNSLAQWAIEKNLVRYHVRPKCHQLGHLTWHFLPRNPRYMQCYADEDFISRTKRVAERSHPVHMSRLNDVSIYPTNLLEVFGRNSMIDVVGAR